MPVMRAKMLVETAELQKFEGYEDQLRVSMRAVYKDGYDETGLDENNTYAKFTPVADLDMIIQNPALVNKIQEGQVFYVDFSEVE